MDKNKIRTILEDADYEIVLEKRYKNYAWRFKLKDGTSVYCGDKNKIWATGKSSEAVLSTLESQDVSVNNKVFIVYGRDLDSRNDLVQMLQSWNVEALAIDSLPVQGRTVIEQLEHYIPQTNFGIILATPDDIGYLAGCESEAKYRARQNVVLELGMLLSKLGRSRIAIVLKKCDSFERPSDIAGILYLEFDNSITEIGSRLKRELNAQGYAIE